MEEYRGFEISYDPPPIPMRNMDYQAGRIDGNGEEGLCIHAGSRADLKALVDEYWAELADAAL